MRAKTAVELPGHGRGGKPKAGFPPRPQPLEIAQSAIPTFPPPRPSHGKVESQSQASHFSTAWFSLSKFKAERRPGGGSLRSRLQAHSSMRKCWLGVTELDGASSRRK